MKRGQVAIIDYALGNVFSIKNACTQAGLISIVTKERSEILNASVVILPGVGAFGEAMTQIKALGLDSILREYVDSGRPLIGICLGMQLLMDSSGEFGEHQGLGFISGHVKHLSNIGSVKTNCKVPHIGWNTIFQPTHSKKNLWANSPLRQLVNNTLMYFVHSLHIVPDDPVVWLSSTSYGDIDICSSVISNNIIGFQFHPENSGNHGLKIYSAIKDLYVA